MHVGGWKIHPTEIQGPFPPVKCLGSSVWGPYRGTPGKVKHQGLHPGLLQPPKEGQSLVAYLDLRGKIFLVWLWERIHFQTHASWTYGGRIQLLAALGLRSLCPRWLLGGRCSLFRVYVVLLLHLPSVTDQVVLTIRSSLTSPSASSTICISLLPQFSDSLFCCLL